MLHRVGTAQPGDVEDASQIPEDAWQDALDMPGSQVAQTTYTPDGWKHEPLRLIIRRSTFTAAEIAKHKGSRRLKTIHPQQLQLALDGQLDCVYGYSFILTDIHWAPPPGSSTSTATAPRSRNA